MPKNIVSELTRINEEKILYIEQMIESFKTDIIVAQKTLSSSLIDYIKNFKIKDGVLDSNQILGSFNADNLTNITQFIKDSGMNEAINDLMKKEAKIIGFIKETYAVVGIPLTFTQRDLNIVKAIQNLDLAKISKISESVIEEINRNLFGQVMGSSKFSDLVDNLKTFVEGAEEKAGIIESRAYTWANTSTYTFDRQILTMKVSGDKEQLYVYSGSLVKDSRDFCVEHIGEVLTKEEIDSLDNGQGLSVWEYCGGFSCGHVWVPIPNEMEEDFGDYREEMLNQLEETKNAY